MPSRRCGVCGYVGAAAAGEVTLSRSGMTRAFQMEWCITCWLSLNNILEDQSLAFTDSLPFRWTQSARHASKNAHIKKLHREIGEHVESDSSSTT